MTARHSGSFVGQLHAWPVTRAPLAFHRLLEGYQPTPLVDAPGLAASLGVGRVLVKDESERLGLPAFKILGASWATLRMLSSLLDTDPASWDSLDDLMIALKPLLPLTLVTATDGNHGRAVARVAKLLGLQAEILVPVGTARARIEAIEGEGAEVIVVDGTYDDAVHRALAGAGADRIVIADTAVSERETVPRWIIDGYSTMFHELDDELAGRGLGEPELLVVPVGVGSLAAAALVHCAGRATRVVGVEPTTSACVTTSLARDEAVTIGPANTSIMAGLNAGTPSIVAWPVLRQGLCATVTIDDDQVPPAMRDLAEIGVVAGETGAAALAGLRAIAEDTDGLRTTLGLGPGSTVVVLVTEGATDPDAYARLVRSA